MKQNINQSLAIDNLDNVNWCMACFTAGITLLCFESPKASHFLQGCLAVAIRFFYINIFQEFAKLINLWYSQAAGGSKKYTNGEECIYHDYYSDHLFCSGAVTILGT